jgi:integrase
MKESIRKKTKYQGVTYLEKTSKSTGKLEKVFIIRYYKDGKQIEEKAGRQYQDAMTASKAALIRAARIEGKEASNKARRQAEGGRWTVDRLWNEYKAQRPDLKGIATDENRYKNYIRPRFGGWEPKDIAPLDIDRLRVNVQKTRTATTAARVLELIRRIINFGLRKNLIEPLRLKIELPRVNNLKTETLTDEQLAALLKVIDENPQYEVAGQMMKMALYTGMRRGEIFRLQWQDIDFERGFINIRESKGDKDTAIPLNDPARTLLNSIDRSETSPFVFPGKDKIEHRKEAKRGLNFLKTEAKLPADFRPMHGLRHHFASGLVSDGVDLYTVGRLLTHKSPDMTRRYAHLSDAALKRASDRAGQLATASVSEIEQKKVAILKVR